jgi:curved DNA-binding protein CbpA
MDLNFYQILGISNTASEEEIKIAYRNLAKKYHPDKNGSNAFYEEHFKKINTAYQTLSKKEKRNRYDLKLRYRASSSSSSSSSGQSSFKNRTSTPGYKNSPHKASKSNKAREKMENERKRKEKEKKKIYVFTGLTLIFIIFCSIYFYNFMNDYSAKLALNNGINKEANKEYFLAMDYYSSALEYNDGFTEAYKKRGELRQRIFNDYKGAFNDYNKAIKTSEKKIWGLYFLRAKCNIKLKKYEEAVADLREAATIKPAYDSLYFYMAEINNYKLDKYKEALKDYRQVLILNNEFSEAYFGKAICHQKLGEFKQAITDLDKVLALDPSSGRAYHFRGFSLLNIQDTIGACNDWNFGSKLGFSESGDAMIKYCHKN